MQAARARGEGDDRARSKRDVGFAQEQAGRGLRGNPGAEVPADQIGLDVLAHASRLGEQFAQRGAESDFVDAGARDRARERDEDRARLGGGPDAAEPGRTEPGDLRDVRDRLRVLDEGRGAADAALEGPRRGERRPGRPAVQELDERGLLPGDEAIGNFHQAKVDAAVEPAAAPALDRLLHCLGSRTVGHCDERLARADRLGCGDRPIEHELGHAAEEHLVLRARRLALGAVDDDDRAPAARRSGA